jgi:AsmA protein
MRNTIIVACALAIMLMGIYGSAVILFDEDRLKSLVAQHVENRTGRKIEIRGDLRIRFFPGLRLSAENVMLSGPVGFDGPDFFTADRLDMQVRLLPLIRGQVRASEVRLGGARINLHTDEDGSSSLDGLLGDGERANSSDWLNGPITIEDVRVSVSDGQLQLRESFEVQRIELDGYAPGQPLEFRFRGNVGEPAMFDWLEVDGLLVAGDAGRLRLSNMSVQGALDDGQYLVEMLGNVTLTAGIPLQVSVDGATLKVNEHEFRLNLNYHGTERPHFSAQIGAELLDVDVLALVGKLSSLPYEPANSVTDSVLRGMDFVTMIEVAQVARLGLTLEGLKMNVRARDGRVMAEGIEATAPGGVIRGSAEMDLRKSVPELSTTIHADIAHMSSLLHALRFDLMIGGAGSMRLDLTGVPPTVSGEVAGWIGTGSVELWDGRWPLLGAMAPASLGFSGSEQFEYLRGAIGLEQTGLELTDFQLVSGELVADGRIGLVWLGQGLEGSLQLTDEDRIIRVELAGSVDQPEMSHTPILLPPPQ